MSHGRIIVKGGFDPSLLPDGERVEPRRLGRFLVELPEGADTEALAELLDRQDGVEYAEPDQRGSADAVPNDPRYSDQWGLPAINMAEAWDISVSFNNVLIGIVDSGLAMDNSGTLNHPDITPGSWWIQGSDFVEDDAIPRDLAGHGTHVTGVAGADRNNSEGIAGIDNVSDLYIVRVLDENGDGWVVDFVDGVEEIVNYANTNNYRTVINFSIGLSAHSADMQAALQYVSDQGHLIICSAGNNSTGVHHPAIHADTIAGAMAVVSVDSDLLLSSFSNSGPEASIAAPGGGILSTTPTYPTTDASGTSGYEYWNGTSMAAPFVTGVAALVWNRYPSLTNVELRAKLEDTAVPLASGSGYGAGLLDAEAALTDEVGGPVGGTSTETFTHDSSSYILNPGIGWQWQSATSGDPDETVSYRRSTVGEFFWDELNPSNGGYSWSRIDNALSTAASQGKQVHFRVIQERGEDFGGHKVPQWVIDLDPQVVNPPSGGGLVRYSRRTYQVQWAKFINALRVRYDGDPRIAAIDIAGFGNFGEYTYFDNHVLDSSPSTPTDLDGYCRRMLMHLYIGGSASNHQDSGGSRSYNYPGFQSTQLIQPDAGIRHHTAMVLRYASDCGVRTDILGRTGADLWDDRDLGGEFPSNTSCKDLVVARYLTAPVAYEMSGNAAANTTSTNTTLSETHGCLVHENGSNGSAADIRAMMRRVGYQLRPVSVTWSNGAAPGGSLTFESVWRNHGFAPAYRRMGQDFDLRVGLRRSNGQMEHEWTLATDPNGWLPNADNSTPPPDNAADETLSVPAGTAELTYTLTVGVYDNRTGQFINLATTEAQYSDNRLAVGTVVIDAGQVDPEPEETNVFPDATAHSHLATGPSVQFIQSITLQSASHQHTAGVPLVWDTASAFPEDTAHGHTSTSPVITTEVDLEIDDARSLQSADEVYVGPLLPSFTPPRIRAPWPWHLKVWRLWRWLEPSYVGLNVWEDADGEWHSGFPTTDDLNAAQTVYLGGRTYQLTDEQADELEANGYEVFRP